MRESKLFSDNKWSFSIYVICAIIGTIGFVLDKDYWLLYSFITPLFPLVFRALFIKCEDNTFLTGCYLISLLMAGSALIYNFRLVFVFNSQFIKLSIIVKVFYILYLLFFIVFIWPIANDYLFDKKVKIVLKDICLVGGHSLGEHNFCVEYSKLPKALYANYISRTHPRGYFFEYDKKVIPVVNNLEINNQKEMLIYIGILHTVLENEREYRHFIAEYCIQRLHKDIYKNLLNLSEIEAVLGKDKYRWIGDGKEYKLIKLLHCLIENDPENAREYNIYEKELGEKRARRLKEIDEQYGCHFFAEE